MTDKIEQLQARYNRLCDLCDWTEREYLHMKQSLDRVKRKWDRQIDDTLKAKRDLTEAQEAEK